MQIIIEIFNGFLECTLYAILKAGKSSHFIDPAGKPVISRFGGVSQAQPASTALSRIRGPAHRRDSFTLDA